MKAAVYQGPRELSVENVSDPTIEHPSDVLVRVTASNICGSDLHMYEGRTAMETGRVLGHENLGEVVEVGSAVVSVKLGDRVCLPFNISCGFCRNCETGLTAFCLNTNPDPGMAGAAYGFAGMGPYNGGQAEYLRVPFGDSNCLKLPDDASEKENDYVMLADIFPTGWHCTELAGVAPGESVVVYGSGPVGLMCAYSAVIKGAAKVMIVDRHPDRLKLAEEIGAVPIDDRKGPPVQQVLEHTDGKGADRGCDCVGYQAHDPQGHEDPTLVLNDLVKTVKFTGGIGVVGLYLPQDPGAPDDDRKKGRIKFEMGEFWLKGQSMATGQADVKRYNRALRELIHLGKAKPSWIVSHELLLSEAPNAYQHFDFRDEGWTKVVLKPQASSS